MRLLRSSSTHSVSRSPGARLALLLLFVVLVPSAGLLWFMDQAVTNERLAVRQKLLDAYRTQLLHARQQLESAWTGELNAIASDAASGTPGRTFAGVVRSGAADAVILRDAAGTIVYPDRPDAARLSLRDAAWRQAAALERTDPAAAAAAYAALADQARTADEAAPALQAQARALQLAGDRTAALALLQEQLMGERFRHARDAAGRLITVNAHLVALELAAAVEPSAVSAIGEKLWALLDDYDHVTMPATQRLFAGRELQKVSPRTDPPRWLTAELLAENYLRDHARDTAEPVLRRSGIPGLWQQSSADGRVVVLHREEALGARLVAAMDQAGWASDARVEFLPPGREAEGAMVSLPAGATFPDWRVVLLPRDPEFFDLAASARTASYAWIVGAVVLVIIALAALALSLVRRQIALTQLRNDLVANVTHELKTPLASMRLLVETLLNAERLDETTTREYLQLIATENLRLSRLIGNFLTFSRIERNKYAFEFHEIAPAAIVEQAAGAVRDRLDGPGCRFAVEVAPDLPVLRADGDALVTALVNLLDNAWKYSGENKVITLSAAPRNGHVTFSVGDNGLGLAPRDTKRIFDRFQQGHHPRSTGGGGVGLGLSIVQFIVTAHRGSIDVASTPGRGSTFTITLPAATTSASGPA